MRTFRTDDPGNAFRRTDAAPVKTGGLYKTDSDDGQNTFTDGQGNKYWFVDTTAGNVTITLPDAAEVTADTIFTVKRTTAGVNTLTVQTGGGLIDGAATQTIDTQGLCYSYISDGENYFVSGVGAGEGSVSISAMITTRLAPYVTSASLTTVLGGYITSGSLATALSPYITSSSVATALGAYVTSSSLATALGAYVTSSSLATALGTYLTSNSASIALATKQPKFSVADEGVTLSTVAGTVTTINFVGAGISASLTGGILTVTGSGGSGSGEGSVSVSSMITTALAGYVTSASVVTALGGYVTSTSLATALGAYVTSGSLATAVGTLLSSASFATAIAPYVTSASLVTTLGTYVTSGSLATALGTYVTSGSLATALATYATSASVVTSLAAKQPNFNVQDEGVTLTTAAGTVTQINFVGSGISASLTGGLLTVTAVAGAGSGEGSVSVSTMISTALGGGYTNTASFAAITLASKPVGCVLLGYQTLSNVNNFAFSGSWSDYCVLQCRALFRVESGTSATVSAAIYTDGGTTAFLGLATVSATASTNQIIALEYDVYGGDGRPIKLMQARTNKQTNLQTLAATATANTGFVNAMKFFTSATITAGMAVLYGFRKA